MAPGYTEQRGQILKKITCFYLARCVSPTARHYRHSLWRRSPGPPVSPHPSSPNSIAGASFHFFSSQPRVPGLAYNRKRASEGRPALALKQSLGPRVEYITPPTTDPRPYPSPRFSPAAVASVVVRKCAGGREGREVGGREVKRLVMTPEAGLVRACKVKAREEKRRRRRQTAIVREMEKYMRKGHLAGTMLFVVPGAISWA